MGKAIHIFLKEELQPQTAEWMLFDDTHVPKLQPQEDIPFHRFFPLRLQLQHQLFGLRLGISTVQTKI
jgi:hypothetical protein